MNTKFIAALVLSVATLIASPLGVCPPDFVQDGRSVGPACPGLGTQFFATPLTFGFLSFNDNPVTQGFRAPGTGDADFNDAALTFLVNSLGTEVTVQWFGGLSAWTNSINLGDTLVNRYNTAPVRIATTPGALLDFVLLTPSGQYYTGWYRNDLTWNYGYQIALPSGSEVPEPGTILLAGLGLALLGLCPKKFLTPISKKGKSAFGIE